MITCSLDQTIKIWNLEKTDFKTPEKTLYDHEEEIIAAVVSPHPDSYWLATADVEGQVIVRDLRKPEMQQCHIRPELEYEPPECVSILFNQRATGQQDSVDLFVAINNQLFYYSIDGDFLKVSGFSSNIVSMSQDKDILMLALENNSIVSYDWHEGEAVQEYNELRDNDTMTSQICIEERASSIVVAGQKSGDIEIFKLSS